MDIIASEMRFDMKVVKGAPYSAKAISQSTQTLGDGTKITHSNEANIFRDGEGRIRREQKLEMPPPMAQSGEAPTMIFISDPVAGFIYELDQNNMTARKSPRKKGPPPLPPEPQKKLEEKTESLGTKSFDGVDAEGTRTSFTIPAGDIGNDRPITVVSERWFSKDLQIVVMTRHSDPRFGENTYQLTNMNRTEAAHSLFEVPAGYTFQPPPPPQGDRQPNGPRPPQGDRPPNATRPPMDGQPGPTEPFLLDLIDMVLVR
jgi:hypothetical protein